MISLYSGTPGSGKSLHLASVIRALSRRGVPIIGNFRVDLSKISKANYTFYPNDELNPDMLMNFSREYFRNRHMKEGALLLVIDECQLLFNSRDWNQKGRNKWLSFFSLHRHYGFDIILVAQMDRMIDRQIRGLIEYEFIHRKLSNYGIVGKIMSVFLGGKIFIAVQVWYPLGEKVGSQIYRANKKLWSIYDTFGAFDDADPKKGELPSPPPKKRGWPKRIKIESPRETQEPQKETAIDVDEPPICAGESEIPPDLSVGSGQEV